MFRQNDLSNTNTNGTTKRGLNHNEEIVIATSVTYNKEDQPTRCFPTQREHVSEAMVTKIVERLHERLMPSSSSTFNYPSLEEDLPYFLLSLNEFNGHDAARLRGKDKLSSKLCHQFDFLF